MEFTNSYQLIKGLYSFKGYCLAGFHDLPERVMVVLEKTGKTGQCPRCFRKRQRFESRYTREIRDLDIVGKKSVIMFPTGVVHCFCGYRGVELLDFVDKHSNFTKRFEECVALLCDKMTNKNVAEVCRIDWKAVKTIDKKFLSRQKVGLDDISPAGIGVDEVAYEKGQKYLTIVRELEHNRVIWIGIERKKEVLDLFFAELGPERSAKITEAVMDMWDPYIASIKEHCPNVAIVFDKFHISKKVNEALDSIRKTEFRKAGEDERKTMKKKRFLILKRQRTLTSDEAEALDALKQKNDRLYSAYLLKEQVLDIFDEENQETAIKRFEMWFENIMYSGLTQFDKVVKTIKMYFYGIENYFRHRITNAGAEGINNKINVIKRMAYGYRDLEYFKLKILRTCGWKS